MHCQEDLNQPTRESVRLSWHRQSTFVPNWISPIQVDPQPGSLDSEAGIFVTRFDQTGSRLITGEADKTIKMWKEDDDATEESHPVSYYQEAVNHRF